MAFDTGRAFISSKQVEQGAADWEVGSNDDPEVIRQFEETLKDPRAQTALPKVILEYLAPREPWISQANPNDGKGISKADLEAFANDPQVSGVEKVLLKYAGDNFDAFKNLTDKGGDNIGEDDLVKGQEIVAEGLAATQLAGVAAFLSQNRDAAGKDGSFSYQELQDLQAKSGDNWAAKAALIYFGNMKNFDKGDGARTLKFWEGPGNSGDLTQKDILAMTERTKVLTSFGLNEERIKIASGIWAKDMEAAMKG